MQSRLTVRISYVWRSALYTRRTGLHSESAVKLSSKHISAMVISVRALQVLSIQNVRMVYIR